MSDCFDPAQDAFNRMKRAHARGTGCHITTDMIESLGLTIVGQLWDDPDPRDEMPNSPADLEGK